LLTVEKEWSHSSCNGIKNCNILLAVLGEIYCFIGMIDFSK